MEVRDEEPLVQIGVGLPSTVPGVDPGAIVEWAAAAEAAGCFSSIGVLDRMVYDSYDPIVSLSSAAGVTDDLRLVSMIVASPLRSTGVLAKEAASLHALSGGRLTLGVALGAREEDYEVADSDWSRRGRILTEQLETLRNVWEDAGIAPSAMRGTPDLLVGGLSGNAYLRVARYADGYVHNGGPARAFASAARKAHAAWQEAGRPGEPQLWGQNYIGLGDPEAGREYLLDYYAFTGPFAERIAQGLLDSPMAVKDIVRGYEDEGCDELILFPTTPDLDELHRLAEIVS